MMRLGLTGSIAAGKSAVSARLRQLGAYIVDADEVSREVVLPGSEGLARLCAAFGTNICHVDGSLDREALGRLCFGNPEKLSELNAILHPLILARMEALCALCPEDIVVIEAPLLIEAGLYARCDRVWLVSAPEAARIERIAVRDGLTREAALLRAAAQMPDAEKRRYADLVIENDGSLATLYEKVDILWENLERES